jgi:ubiquinone/menaquinone biosynthesis C-methylase UbiE
MFKEYNTSCPICGANSLSPTNKIFVDYITKDKFTLLECRACECFITASFSEKLTGDYYGAAYYNSEKGKFSFLIEKIFRRSHQQQALFFYRHFYPEAVLEIGCGRAYQLQEFKKLGCLAYGLESANAPEWILHNPLVEVKSLKAESERWPFPANFFQLVIFWHALEHLSEPVRALQETNRVLQNNQMVCINIPNVSSLQARINLASWFHLDVPRHLFHFSKKSLIKLLNKNGYQIIRATSGDMLQNLYGWWQSLANIFTPHDTNSLYRFLQGGAPRKTVPIFPLLIQLLTVFIWLPLGIAGYIAELITGNTGVISIQAKKVEE